MFQATLDIVDDCGLTHLHVFPFSPRKGTPAARMPQVERQEIKARAARLREKGDAVLGVYFDAMQGREVEVLMERPDVGRTPQFAEVTTNTARMVGDIATVRIAGHDGRRLAGVLRA
jgi:threonylcarbamoyladenosine tRNA methylthiotransferase MtaB